MTVLAAHYSAHWALYPKSYTVTRAPYSFLEELDGDLNKRVWENIPWSDVFDDIQGPQDAPSTAIPAARTQWKACYDDTHLYIGAVLFPSEHFGTEAHFTARNSPIYQKDSDFECFIDVTMSHHFYKEVEVNALNTVWNLMLDKPYIDGGREHSGRQHREGDNDYYEVYHQRSAVRVIEGTLNDPFQGALWSVEIALAYQDLYAYTGQRGDNNSKAPTPGALWRVNFSRVELGGKVNWTWQPQIVWNGTKFQGQINMHLPDAWGYISFDIPRKDPLWPAKLTAMHIYYAQQIYREKEGTFAHTIEPLGQYMNHDIIAPFENDIIINTETNGSAYSATVCFGNDCVTIQHDRLMTVHSLEDSAAFDGTSY